MKIKFLIYPVLLTGLLLTLLFSCQKLIVKVVPTVTLASVTNVTGTTASSGGEITSDGGAAINARGVCWSTSQNPTTADSNTSDGTGSGSFISSITGLTPGTTYNIRAYATNVSGTTYSNQVTFTTKNFVILDIKQETNWDYYVIGHSGESFFIQLSNSKPNVLFYKPDPNKDGFPIYIDEFGRPSKTIINGNIFLFGNYNTNSVDVSVVNPDGEIKLFRNIHTDVDWSSYSLKSLKLKSATSDAFKYSSIVIGSVSCIVGLVAALPTGGISLGLSVSCGTTLLSAIALAFPEELQSVGINSLAIGTVNTWLTCINPTGIDCILGVASKAFSVTGIAFQLLEDKKDPITNATVFLNDAKSITDKDYNPYHTVTIGSQVWMVENLKTTKYRNGDPIPNVTDGTTWVNLTTGAYCNYNNDANNAKTYGRLYNWYAVDDSRNIAPTGWHVPSDDEWAKLTTYLGGEMVAGGKLKETGYSHWLAPNTGATNETGFTALPGGDRIYYGTFYSIGNYGYLWSSTAGDASNAWYRNIGYGSAYVVRGPVGSGKQNGFSVRCVRD